MIFGLSFGIAFDFITTMQLLSLFPIARLYMPTSLMEMFRWFQIYNFKFIGLQYSLWEINDMIQMNNFDGGGKPIDYNFSKMGWSTDSFFLNAAEVVIFAIYLSFLVPICSMITMFFPCKFCLNTYRNLRDSFIFGFFNLTFCRFVFTAYMNFRFF